MSKCDLHRGLFFIVVYVLRSQRTDLWHRRAIFRIWHRFLQGVLRYENVVRWGGNTFMCNDVHRNVYSMQCTHQYHSLAQECLEGFILEFQKRMEFNYYRSRFWSRTAFNGLNSYKMAANLSRQYINVICLAWRRSKTVWGFVRRRFVYKNTS